MNIGELAKFRAGIEIPASGTVVTTYVKAADTQGLALVNSSGTSVVTVTDAGAGTLGPSSGLNATHLVQSAASNSVIASVKNTAASSNTYVSFVGGSTTLGFIGHTADGTLNFLGSNGSTVRASCTDAGVWTFGNSSLTTYHQIVTGITSVSTAAVWVGKAANVNQNNNIYALFYGATGTDEGFLQTNGSGVFSVADASDVRFKTNIRKASYGLSTILSLKPVEFDWVSGCQNVKGFIAQDVKEVLPECVTIKESSGIKDAHFLETQTMIPVLVKAIQELSAKLDEANARIAALEEK
jgi:hypothetical protein